jgi:hypothetical protein
MLAELGVEKSISLAWSQVFTALRQRYPETLATFVVDQKPAGSVLENLRLAGACIEFETPGQGFQGALPPQRLLLALENPSMDRHDPVA